MRPKPQKPDFWFPAKQYGIGWGLPMRWQGWFFVAIWGPAFMAGLFLFAQMESNYWAIWVVVHYAGLIGILLAVCWWKGEKPVRWRWGKEDEPGLCQNCGYDLTGNVAGICPECGEKIPGEEVGG